MLLVGLALGLGCALSLASSRVSAQAGTGVIAGRVLDAITGQPVKGAIVRLHDTDEGMTVSGDIVRTLSEKATELSTGNDGAFEFGRLPPGHYFLWVQHRAYMPGAYAQKRHDDPRPKFELRAGEQKRGVVVKLWRPGVIAGRVTDEAGDAVGDVSVRLLLRVFRGGRERWAPADRTDTDDEGVFRFSATAPGEYVVAVPSTTATWPAETADRLLSAEPDEAVGLLGRLGRSGAPAPTAAAVTAGAQRMEWFGPQPNAPVATGERLSTLVGYPTHFHPGTTEIDEAVRIHVEPGKELLNVGITLRPREGRRVSGTLSGPEGPAADVGLRLVPIEFGRLLSDRGFEAATTVTDARGRFTFAGVFPGRYALRALIGVRAWTPPPNSPQGLLLTTPVSRTVLMAPNRSDEPLQWAEASVVVEDEDLESLEIPLRPALRLGGRVVVPTAPNAPNASQIINMIIYLDPVDTIREGAMVTARPDRSGAFTTPDYPPGRYRIFVGMPNRTWRVASILLDGQDVLGGSLNLTTADISDVVVTLTDKEATLSGTVVGEPEDIRNARIVLFPANISSWIDLGMDLGQVATSVAGEGGLFTLRNLRPGVYLVGAVTMGSRVDSQDPEWVRAIAPLMERVRVDHQSTAAVTLKIIKRKN